METKKQGLISILKYFFLYILISIIAIPLSFYGVSFFFDHYLLGNETSFEAIMNNSALDDVALILANLFIIVLFIKKKYTHINISKKSVGTISWNKNVILWAVLLELASILPVNILVASLNLSDYNMAVLSQETQSITSVFTVCLLVPFAEELVFRGGIEEQLIQWKNNVIIAILLSSFLFAIMHVYPSLIVGTFLSGILTGWVYYRTRDVWICFFMHMTNNMVSCLIEWLQTDDSSGSDILFETKIIILALFSLIFMAAAVSNLKKITSKVIMD